MYLYGTEKDLSLSKAIFRLGTYKCKHFEEDSWIEQHHNDKGIYCTFCDKLLPN